MSHDSLRFDTLAIHAGQTADPTSGAVMIPITLSSTFAQRSPGKPEKYDYSRAGNPNRDSLEANVAALERGQFAAAFASGCAAMTAIVQGLCRPGDHIVGCDDVYGGTARLLDRIFSEYDIHTSWIDLNDEDALAKTVTDKTRLVWIETPTNPLLKIIDLQKVSSVCRQRGVISVVDNTFATPFLQNPLSLGADIVVHSTTKYINGHSDVIGGIVVTNSAELYDKIHFIQFAAGAVPSPFDCYLTQRGLKTLHVRMQRHCENAEQLASWLKQHSAVSRVLYPGLSDHPGHAIAKQQMKNFGGMLSFVLKGGAIASKQLLEKVAIFTCAESLGGVESLIEVPALMTHASISAERRAQIGIDDGLVRVSVGIEDIEDLKQDLNQGM